MRLISLDITNFRVIRQARLTFPNLVIGIVGPNGSGKSSLVEAIGWALYGQKVARSSKEEIKSTYAPLHESCRVTLEFELNGDKYCLTRKLVGARDKTEVSLSREGDSESVGTSDTERYVAELLGLDWRGFLTSFLARQQELNALADLTPVKRRDQLAGMLGIDRLDLAIKELKTDRKVQGEQVRLLERQLLRSESLQADLVRLREHEVQLAKQAADLAGALEKAARTAADREHKYREHQEKKATCSQIETKIEAESNTTRHLVDQQAKAKTELTRLNSAESEIRPLETKLADFEPLKTERDRLRQAGEKESRRHDLAEQVAAWDRELVTIRTSENAVQTDLKRLQTDLAAIPGDTPARFEQVRLELEQTRQTYADARAEIKAKEASQEKTRDQVESIGAIGPETVCDRCLRPFGDDLPSIRQHLKSELEALEDELVSLNGRSDQLKTTGEKLREDFGRLETATRRRESLELKIPAAERELAGHKARATEVAAKRDLAKRKLVEIGEVPFSPERLAELDRLIADLKREQEKYLLLTGELRARPEVEERIRQTAERIELTDKAMTALKAELKALAFDPARFQEAAAEFEKSRATHEKAREEHNRASGDLDLIRREVELKGEELASLGKIAQELEEVQLQQFHSEKLVSLFTDFRKYTISRIRPRLAELTSQLMVEMSGGRYSLVELDEDYNLRIMDNGSYYGVDRFSGGEKDLASLCLRLAISLAITESAGLDRSFVILDEVFGSQDSSRRDLIFDALANLKERFPQMILITHLDELKDKVEQLVELKQQPGGWSEVKENGQTV